MSLFDGILIKSKLQEGSSYVRYHSDFYLHLWLGTSQDVSLSPASPTILKT